MSIFGIAITYAVCWWLVLFMVLPWGVQLDKAPKAGHAASAPVRPQMRKKMLITTLLTLIPTLVIQLLISNASAKEAGAYRDPDIYHTKGAGGGCKPATVPNESAAVPVDINVPMAPYFDGSSQGSTANQQAGGQSLATIGMGKGEVGADGSLTLNGKRIGAPQATGECPAE